ncbi:hypothetical protein [Cardinium endosymbiont of Dermatophagoides farinae]|uniref:hypothetical protein n=1 Tax=Cardinium endosymbiont of Dermatophagoides farinae TaxID=2597823 RepID=UPI001CB952C4|nr:hypothetical protein [Cardinium endosymbiont of Dermatophagoides farinae]
MAETVGSIYGRYPRIITALVDACNCIIGVTMQINIISQSIGMCLGLTDPFLITAFSTLLLIFYSTFGGIRSVAFTDVLQFITFSIIIPFLAWFMFVKTNKTASEVIPMI